MRTAPCDCLIDLNHLMSAVQSLYEREVNQIDFYTTHTIKEGRFLFCSKLFHRPWQSLIKSEISLLTLLMDLKKEEFSLKMTTKSVTALPTILRTFNL